jgi:DNA-binding IclR family transcriptional regulator
MAARSLVAAARPFLESLRDATGESVQLYVPRGDVRVCVLSLESPHGLRTIVPVGAALPMDRGSAAKIFQPGARDLAESVEERERGVASVSAAVHDLSGAHVAAVLAAAQQLERAVR